MAKEVPSIDEFASVYWQRQQLADKHGSGDTTIGDLLAVGIERADQRLAELAEDPAVAAHYTAIGQGPVQAAAELDEVAPTLEALGMADEVQERRHRLQELLDSPDMQAARYYFSIKGGVALIPHTPEKPAAPAAAEPTPAAPATPESGESAKPHLTIVVGTNNNIRVNSKVISLGRDLQARSKYEGGEAALKQLRADVLVFLIEHPGQTFRSGEIWAAIRPDQEFSRGIWTGDITEFFRDELRFSNKPIVTVDKVKPKLYHWSIQNFTAEVTKSDKPINAGTEAVFIRPDGVEIAGKSGRLLNIMSTRPATVQDAIGLYTAEDLAKLKTQPEHLLSSLAAGLDEALKGGRLHVKRVPSEEVNPETHRTYSTYVLVEGEASDESEAGVEPSPDEVESGKAEEHLSLIQARTLASLVSRASDDLEAGPIDHEVIAAIHKECKDLASANPPTTPRTENELHQIRGEALVRVLNLLNNEDELSRTIDALDGGDPRLKLLEYFMGLSEEDQQVIKEAINIPAEFTAQVDGSRYGSSVVTGVKKIKQSRSRNKRHGRR